MNRSIVSLITLLLGFWCCTITLLLFRTFSVALRLSSKLAIVANSGLWTGMESLRRLETTAKANYEMVIKI